ncbi:MAG TPA: TonB-dependent receptor, partial [Parvularcula sp.]|nr:TonB-dependent receptor [Parvularcula sp.]
MARLRRLIRLSCALTSALSGVSALSILTATSASAQSQGLDEVTVTAQRREENQQEVPISITTLPEDRFTAILQGADDIRALATRVPGLYAESSNGRIAPRFYIRGLGNTDFDLAASQPVSIVMDEIVMENVVLKSFPLFDIERVEVLRGPQGTLFGRNTPAGIVKFDTVKPGDETEGYISGSIGRLTTAKVEGAIGLPLTDTLSVRASVLYQGRNDWVDNGAVLQNGFAGEEDAFGGFSDFAGRFQVAWSPTENFDALINFHGRKLEGTSELFRANIFSPGSNELNGNFDRGVVYYDQGGGNNQSYDTYGGSARLTLDLGAVDVISITGFETANGNSRGDIDGGSGAGFLPNGSFPGPIPFPSDTKDAIDDHDQFTQEIRFASDYEGPISWQAGFFYFDSDLTITTNPFFVAATTVRHDNESWALFAQGSYDLTDRLNFTGGVRYTEDDKDLIGVATNFPVAPVAVSDEKVTWDAALTFAATDAINFYARVARGFRAPTIQGRDVAFFGAPTTASSETVVSYEAGVKSTLFDNRMRFNASGWYYDANNLQFSAIGGLGNFNQLVNADGEAWGFEADAEWLV